MLEEGKALIDNRQKLIRIADRSEFGWLTVNDYLSDELASNSEDEKRLSKAEKSAAKKAELNKKNSRNKKASKSDVYNNFAFTSRSQNYPKSSFFRPTFNRSPRFSRFGQRPGTCFACGGVGHFRSECPNMFHQRGDAQPGLSRYPITNPNDKSRGTPQ